MRRPHVALLSGGRVNILFLRRVYFLQLKEACRKLQQAKGKVQQD